MGGRSAVLVLGLPTMAAYSTNPAPQTPIQQTLKQTAEQPIKNVLRVMQFLRQFLMRADQTATIRESFRRR